MMKNLKLGRKVTADQEWVLEYRYVGEGVLPSTVRVGQDERESHEKMWSRLAQEHVHDMELMTSSEYFKEP
jgi:hypothetical protein